MNLKDTMMLYGVTLGARRTRRQKNLFARQCRETLEQSGFHVAVHEYKSAGNLCENLTGGDLENAKIIISTALDTPPAYFKPLDYYPFHPEYARKAEQKKILIRSLLALTAVLLFYFPVSSFYAKGLMIPSLLCIAVLFGIILYLVKCPSAKCSFNRFSASIAVMMRLAEELHGQKKTAFAFCDRSCTGYLGLMGLSKQLKEEQTLLFLSTLASGEKLVITCREKSRVLAEKLKKKLPEENVILRCYTDEESKRNVLGFHEKMIVLACGEIENREFIVHDTCIHQDVELDLNRLERITDALLQVTGGQQS